VGSLSQIINPKKPKPQAGTPAAAVREAVEEQTRDKKVEVTTEVEKARSARRRARRFGRQSLLADSGRGVQDEETSRTLGSA